MSQSPVASDDQQSNATGATTTAGGAATIGLTSSHTSFIFNSTQNRAFSIRSFSEAKRTVARASIHGANMAAAAAAAAAASAASAAGSASVPAPFSVLATEGFQSGEFGTGSTGGSPKGAYAAPTAATVAPQSGPPNFHFPNGNLANAVVTPMNGSSTSTATAALTQTRFHSVATSDGAGNGNGGVVSAAAAAAAGPVPMDLLRHVAAIVIQCVWRSFCARRRVKAMKERRRAAFRRECAETLDAARVVTVQSAVRSHQAKKRVQFARDDAKAGNSDPTGIAALSSSFHKHHPQLPPPVVQQKQQQNGNGDDEEGANGGFFAQEVAAIAIQSQVRRMQAEKRAEEERAARRNSGGGSTASSPRAGAEAAAAAATSAASPPAAAQQPLPTLAPSSGTFSDQQQPQQHARSQPQFGLTAYAATPPAVVSGAAAAYHRPVPSLSAQSSVSAVAPAAAAAAPSSPQQQQRRLSGGGAPVRFIPRRSLTQTTLGAPLPSPRGPRALTGEGLAAVFWDATGVLLNPRRHERLWGLRALHAAAMAAKQENNRAVAQSRQQRSSSSLSSSQQQQQQQPAAAVVTIWMPELPETLWAHGPLRPSSASINANRAEDGLVSGGGSLRGASVSGGEPWAVPTVNRLGGGGGGVVGGALTPRRQNSLLGARLQPLGGGGAAAPAAAAAGAPKSQTPRAR